MQCLRVHDVDTLVLLSTNATTASNRINEQRAARQRNLSGSFGTTQTSVLAGRGAMPIQAGSTEQKLSEFNKMYRNACWSGMLAGATRRNICPKSSSECRLRASIKSIDKACDSKRWGGTPSKSVGGLTCHRIPDLDAKCPGEAILV